MKGTRYIDGILVTQEQLENTERYKTEAIKERFGAIFKYGIVRTDNVSSPLSVTALSSTEASVSPGEAYTDFDRTEPSSQYGSYGERIYVKETLTPIALKNNGGNRHLFACYIELHKNRKLDESGVAFYTEKQDSYVIAQLSNSELDGLILNGSVFITECDITTQQTDLLALTTDELNDTFLGSSNYTKVGGVLDKVHITVTSTNSLYLGTVDNLGNILNSYNTTTRQIFLLDSNVLALPGGLIYNRMVTADNNGIIVSHSNTLATSGNISEIVDGIFGGTGNTFLGSNTAKTGTYNTVYGSNAFNENTTGTNNTAIGSSALNENLSADYNTALGSHALFRNSIGGENVAVGTNALRENIEGGGNVAVGVGAGNYINSTHNTFLGCNAGYNFTTGGGNICIGNGAGPTTTSTLSNKLFIDYEPNDTPLIYGDFFTNEVIINGTLNSTSYQNQFGSLLGASLGKYFTAPRYLTGYFGSNVYWDGSNWHRQTDTANNAGCMIAGHITGGLGFFMFPSTGGGDALVSDTNLSTYEKVSISATGDITATTFIGALNGTATNADTVDNKHVNGGTVANRILVMNSTNTIIDTATSSAATDSNLSLLVGGGSTTLHYHAPRIAVFYYTGSLQNFSKPAGVTDLIVEMIGGGGGGEGGDTGGGAFGGGGGGAGGYLKGYFSVSSSALSISVSIGQGGSGGATGVPGAAGTSGSNTWISGTGISAEVAGGQGGGITSTLNGGNSGGVVSYAGLTLEISSTYIYIGGVEGGSGTTGGGYPLGYSGTTTTPGGIGGIAGGAGANDGSTYGGGGGGSPFLGKGGDGNSSTKKNGGIGAGGGGGMGGGSAYAGGYGGHGIVIVYY